MDTAGARALKARIEQRIQWQEAASVSEGRQPQSDPDAEKLESFEDGVRRYHSEKRFEYVDGQRKLVTCRIFKRLIDGSWETDVVVESVEPAPELTVVQY
jgi:hypothetical protein